MTSFTELLLNPNSKIINQYTQDYTLVLLEELEEIEDEFYEFFENNKKFLDEKFKATYEKTTDSDACKIFNNYEECSQCLDGILLKGSHIATKDFEQNLKELYFLYLDEKQTPNIGHQIFKSSKFIQLKRMVKIYLFYINDKIFHDFFYDQESDFQKVDKYCKQLAIILSLLIIFLFIIYGAYMTKKFNSKIWINLSILKLLPIKFVVQGNLQKEFINAIGEI